jgi:putative transposase
VEIPYLYMKYNPDIHHRRSIRLKGYDYSQPGAYFVTMVTRHRECLFGEVMDGKMRLNEAGMIVKKAWLDLPNHYPHLLLDAFCIMPNHLHGIFILVDDPGRGGSGIPYPLQPENDEEKFDNISSENQTRPYQRHGLPEIVRSVKSFSARRINRLRGTPGVSVWQRDYFERVIRNERELNAIRRYIQDNPLKWERDRENPNIVTL